MGLEQIMKNKSILARRIILAAIVIISCTNAVWSQNSGDDKAAEQKKLAALVKAIRDKNVSEVKRLSASVEDINAATDDNGATALMTAAADGNAEIVKTLIAAGARLNRDDGKSQTALMYAARKRNAETVRALLKAGVKTDTKDFENRNAAAIAKMSGDEPTAQLIETTARLNAALIEAVNAGDAAKIATLVAQGASPNAPTSDPDGSGQVTSALAFAAKQNDAALIDALLKAGADINFIQDGTEESTALDVAVTESSPETVQKLINANPSRRVLSNALAVAVYKSREEIVPILLKAGADVNEQFGIRQNAVANAIANGDVVMVRLLLKAGAARATINDALIAVAGSSNVGDSNVENEKALLIAGADANYIKDDDSGQSSALMAAAESGKEEVVKLLLKAGANAKNVGLAIILATSENREGLVNLLLKTTPKPDVNFKSAQLDRTALMVAAEKGNAEIAQMLLAAGADVNIRDTEEKTALQIATEKGNTKIVEMLKKAGAKE
ncbi:MAG: hypothetical protein NVSMB56_16890 [Pyrinomonadaceae bacterium]